MWDAFQREVLVAMGHTLLVPVAGQPPAHGPVATPVAESTPAPRRTAVAAGAPQPPLLHALAVAAGVDPDQIAQRVALPVEWASEGWRGRHLSLVRGKWTLNTCGPGRHDASENHSWLNEGRRL